MPHNPNTIPDKPLPYIYIYILHAIPSPFPKPNYPVSHHQPLPSTPLITSLPTRTPSSIPIRPRRTPLPTPTGPRSTALTPHNLLPMRQPDQQRNPHHKRQAYPRSRKGAPALLTPLLALLRRSPVLPSPKPNAAVRPRPQQLPALGGAER